MKAECAGSANALRLGFAGTPEFASVALKAILEAGMRVDVVLSQPDRPAGRGLKLKASPVKQLALEHRIPVLQPATLKKGEEAAHALRYLREAADGAPLDVLIVAAYGLILPQEVLDAPRLGCLNIHGSLLPRWRGAAPIQRAIEAGDTETGICIMQMEAGLDTGPVRSTRRLPIGLQDTANSLHDKLAVLGGEAIVEALQRLAQGALPIEDQPQHGVTYADKIQKAEGGINWSDSALVLQRKLRAFDPFPGCSTFYKDELLKCFDPDVLNAPLNGGVPGEVLSVSAEGLVVQTGQGGLLIRTLQRPGSRRMPAHQVASALELTPGDVLTVQTPVQS